MSHSLLPLTDPDTLRSLCTNLSRKELEGIQRNLQALIEEAREQAEQRTLKQKGERSLKEMRGLMARAGISMEEFQAALGKL
ncbi:hypothetical protein [Motiliproteus sp. SC1-56]|uniref:H-NS family histone-like protein n=1 Tax=Motiliproteus sp. SC1-56 TaxID=2799565 RepID=UPI001A8DB5D0|nr:hypothetical protein [Motiliproteus sp. SC1-56]